MLIENTVLPHVLHTEGLFWEARKRRNMDITGLITALNRLHSERSACWDGFTFYFDETNNIRKFTLDPLKDSMVNDANALFSDFILGGICFEQKSDCESLFSALKLQPNIKELKSRHLLSKDFLADIDTSRVTAFLNWFTSNPHIFIHYAVVNNLYYSLVDIVDSLFGEYPQMIAYHVELKDGLYRICQENKKEILELLCKYNYPNISREFAAEFARKISDLIDNADVRDNFFTECMRQMLKSLPKAVELAFIHDNEPFALIENYADYYLQRCITFLDGKLVFDIETEVMKLLDKWGITSQPNKYIFINSTNEHFIQVSDCVVGLLSRLFRFLDSLDVESALTFPELSTRQMDNLKAILGIINRSNDKSEFLIMGIHAQSVLNERYLKLKLICEGNPKKS